MPTGEPCGGDPAPDMPFPICGDHAEMIGEALGKRSGTDFLQLLRADLADRRTAFDAQYAARAQRTASQSVVYYIRLDVDTIKIGVTTNLRERMSQLRVRADRLLATEPGDRSDEAQRHAEFAHLRDGRLENFQAAPELLELVGQLRQQFGPPKITTYQAAEATRERSG